MTTNKMATKLVQWLFVAALYLGFWAILLANFKSIPVLVENETLVLFLPIITVGIFGLYAVVVILWRVYTFNDCEEATRELMEQIKEAKKDLKSKGFVFREETAG